MKRPWVAIQRNPISGSGARRALLLELIAELRRHGLRPRLFSQRERLVRRLEVPDRRDGLVGIVAAGGDGTVGDVVNRYPGVPIAILPLGTENLLAGYLRIPRSGRAVADLIAAGHTRRFDLGTIGERRFTLMASVGFDADIVHRTHARRTGNISRFSYLQPIWDAVRRYEHPPLRLFTDGAESPLTARLVVVVNIPAYALGLKVAMSARGDDGRLDLRLFEPKSAFQMARYFYTLLRGRHEALPDVQSVQATQVRIEADIPVPVQVDGDPAGFTPVDIRVLPAALEVFAPQVV